MIKSRLAAILGERRAKISAISHATGISRTTLTNLYYCKNAAISFAVLDRLCEYLECTPGDLLCRQEVERNG